MARAKWPTRPAVTPPAPIELKPEHRLTKAQVRMLLQLVHPDKHGNSELANKATRFLQEYDAY